MHRNTRFIFWSFPLLADRVEWVRCDPAQAFYDQNNFMFRVNLKCQENQLHDFVSQYILHPSSLCQQKQMWRKTLQLTRDFVNSMHHTYPCLCHFAASKWEWEMWWVRFKIKKKFLIKYLVRKKWDGDTAQEPTHPRARVSYSEYVCDGGTAAMAEYVTLLICGNPCRLPTCLLTKRANTASGCTRCTMHVSNKWLFNFNHLPDVSVCVMSFYFRWFNGWKAEWHSSRHSIHSRQNCSTVSVTSSTDCECIDKWRAFDGINSSRTKPTGRAINGEFV